MTTSIAVSNIDMTKLMNIRNFKILPHSILNSQKEVPLYKRFFVATFFAALPFSGPQIWKAV
jgi:hypothetical protein